MIWKMINFHHCFRAMLIKPIDQLPSAAVELEVAVMEYFVIAEATAVAAV